ncbi:type IV toxin-antitoxin system AbiEi family antitoxin domain-containing protein [Geodermatophilus sp. SYSU D00697]
MSDDSSGVAGDVIRRVDAPAAGLSDADLSRMVRRGDLQRIQRGAFLPAGTAVALHRAVVSATVAGLRRPVVVSHVSAAPVHGLPVWGTSPHRVHVTRRPQRRAAAARACTSTSLGCRTIR